MTEPLPAYDVDYLGEVHHDDKTDEDWVVRLCIEKGLLQGLDVESADGADQWGEMVVRDVNGMAHTFKIHVPPPIPIPDDEYTLLRSGVQWYSSETDPKYWAVGR